MYSRGTYARRFPLHIMIQYPNSAKDTPQRHDIPQVLFPANRATLRRAPQPRVHSPSAPPSCARSPVSERRVSDGPTRGRSTRSRPVVRIGLSGWRGVRVAAALVARLRRGLAALLQQSAEVALRRLSGGARQVRVQEKRTYGGVVRARLQTKASKRVRVRITKFLPPDDRCMPPTQHLFWS